MYSIYRQLYYVFLRSREGSVAWKNTTFVFWCVVSQKFIDSTKTVLVCFPKISHFALKDPQLINIWTRATLASPYSTFSQYCIRCSPGCFATASTLPVITSSCSPTLPEQEYSPSTIKASGESTITYTTSSWVADEIQQNRMPPASCTQHHHGVAQIKTQQTLNLSPQPGYWISPKHRKTSPIKSQRSNWNLHCAWPSSC